MSDEHLLRRIMMLGNELSECQQDAILNRNLAMKAQEKNVHLQGLLGRCYFELKHIRDVHGYEHAGLMRDLTEAVKDA